MALPLVQENAAPTATPSLHDSQHDHITSCLGFHLHPTISTHLLTLVAQDTRPRIADIRCGPGTFLGSLAASSDIPAAYVGFDPHPPAPNPALPSLSFHTWDILSPSPPSSLPPTLLSSFDVLIVRGLHLLMPPTEDGWGRVLGAVAALARPGAYVQWLDFDPLTARIAATRPLAPDADVRRALAEFTDAARARRCGNAARIDRELGKAGFGEEGDADLYPLRPKVEFTEALVREVGEVMRRYGAWDRGEVEGRVGECLREVKEAGALVWYDLWCHIGRREGVV